MCHKVPYLFCLGAQNFSPRCFWCSLLTALQSCSDLFSFNWSGFLLVACPAATCNSNNSFAWLWIHGLPWLFVPNQQEKSKLCCFDADIQNLSTSFVSELYFCTSKYWCKNSSGGTPETNYCLTKLLQGSSPKVVSSSWRDTLAWLLPQGIAGTAPLLDSLAPGASTIEIEECYLELIVNIILLVNLIL